MSDRSRERLLMLSTFVPIPPNNGSSMRVWAMLRCLAAEEDRRFGEVVFLLDPDGFLQRATSMALNGVRLILRTVIRMRSFSAPTNPVSLVR
jgi:hypothetical protein